MTGLRDRLQRLAALSRFEAAPRRQRAPVNADLLVDVVELVNWVYADQRARIVDGRGIGLHEAEKVAAGVLARDRAGGKSTQGRFTEIMLLGVEVDREGYDTGDLHPVAETVHLLVAKTTQPNLVMQFAEKREVPLGATFDIHLGPMWKVEPRYDVVVIDGKTSTLPKQGAFHMRYDKNKHPVECPLELDHGPEFMGKLRAEYIAWHDALSELVYYCCRARSDLGGLVVTGPAALREPWRNGQSYKGVKGVVL